jgi:hypothetical protein
LGGFSAGSRDGALLFGLGTTVFGNEIFLFLAGRAASGTLTVVILGLRKGYFDDRKVRG